MRILIFALCAMAIFIACHKKAIPTVADRTVQPPPPIVPTPAPATYTESAIAAGKTIYETKCTRCHMAKPVESYTAERWPGILKSMVPRSKLTEDETNQLTAYVITNAKKS